MRVAGVLLLGGVAARNGVFANWNGVLNLGFPELVVILVLVVIFFGPTRLGGR